MAALWVFLGGGTGAALRWALSQAIPGPWGVVLINALGSAALAALAHPGLGASPAVRLAVGTGVLGGFTTYSTFNLDLLTALQARHWLRAVGLVVATLGGCLLGGGLSWWAVGALTATSDPVADGRGVQ